MKLKNKQTGEIAEASILNFELVVRYDDGRVEKYPLLFDYSNFECYEEPKKYWFIDNCGDIHETPYTGDDLDKDRKLIGNHFKTEEEAKKAVEKLKAFKRLKDKGLHFTTFYVEDGSLVIRAKARNSSGAENWEDLDLLFSGGEE